MNRLPIGIENFKAMIDEGYYYVDKTLFIKDVLNEKVVLYTRPRRFGKTLNMSMLYYFFSMKEKENAYLFDNLEISNDCDALLHQHAYPVVFITLKDMKRADYKMQIEKFGSIISDIVNANPELLNSPMLNTAQKNLLIQYQNETSTISNLMDALFKISICMQLHFQKKVIILIDEYDVPLQMAYLNGYYDEMVDFLRNVFSAALKTNDALEKGILTGCLRIAKESIFTGLNNFKVNSIFDEASNQRFGFTQNEIGSLLQDYHASEYQSQMKEWYDGYQFGGCDIYNPWSALMYMDKLINTSRKVPESFWANTSGNDIIYRYIKEANPNMRDEFDILASGGMIEKTIKDDITYREMGQINNVYSFLLYTGYLKAVRCVDEEQNMYQLMIPNKEIKRIYVSIFSEWFNEQLEHNGLSFMEALIREDVKQANDILDQILFQSISYFDYDEKFYHGVLIGLLNQYHVVSNHETGLGRSDIAVLPPSRLSRGVVLELKVASTVAALKPMAEKACEQIKTQKYIEGLYADGYEDIIGYGIAFHKKSCVITSLKDI
ncbi:ATP-binding protein [[Clostridium] innocuum]|nr:ATP-binding protein [[Clostridium] innocuum]MCR0270492.1 ATP-binding protein [[Clostridium] innocuum]